MRLLLLPGMDGTGRLFEGFVRAIDAALPTEVVEYLFDACLGYGALETNVRSRFEAGEPTVIVAESIDLCESVFADAQDYAREKHLPIGINVESVSIRKSEVEASVELFRRLSSRLTNQGTVRGRPTHACSG